MSIMSLFLSVLIRDHSFNSNKNNVQICEAFSLMCSRILLVFIAILSAYSIHLLLKSAGVVGKPELDSTHMTCPQGQFCIHDSSQSYICNVFVQGSELMSSSGTGLLAPQEKCWPRASLRYTTLEVLSCRRLTFMLTSESIW